MHTVFAPPISLRFLELQPITHDGTNGALTTTAENGITDEGKFGALINTHKCHIGNDINAEAKNGAQMKMHQCTDDTNHDNGTQPAASNTKHGARTSDCREIIETLEPTAESQYR